MAACENRSEQVKRAIERANAAQHGWALSLILLGGIRLILEIVRPSARQNPPVDHWKSPDGTYDLRMYEFTTDSGGKVRLHARFHPRHQTFWEVVYDVNGKGAAPLAQRFESPDEMLAHYKDIRPELLKAVQEITNVG